MSFPFSHGDTPPGRGGQPRHIAASKLIPCTECGKYRPYKVVGPRYNVVLYEVTGELHTHG